MAFCSQKPMKAQTNANFIKFLPEKHRVLPGKYELLLKKYELLPKKNGV
jgi:hypothetical protein